MVYESNETVIPVLNGATIVDISDEVYDAQSGDYEVTNFSNSLDGVYKYKLNLEEQLKILELSVNNAQNTLNNLTYSIDIRTNNLTDTYSNLKSVLEGEVANAISIIDNKVDFSNSDTKNQIKGIVENTLNTKTYVEADKFANFLTLDSTYTDSNGNESYGAINIINDNFTSEGLTSTLLFEADKFAFSSPIGYTEVEGVKKLNSNVEVYTPFSIDTSTHTLKFNGLVSFTEENVDTTCFNLFAQKVKELLENDPSATYDSVKSTAVNFVKADTDANCSMFNSSDNFGVVMGNFLMNSKIITEEIIADQGFLNQLAIGFSSGKFGDTYIDTNYLKNQSPVYTINNGVKHITVLNKDSSSSGLESSLEFDLNIVIPSGVGVGGWSLNETGHSLDSVVFSNIVVVKLVSNSNDVTSDFEIISDSTSDSVTLKYKDNVNNKEFDYNELFIILSYYNGTYFPYVSPLVNEQTFKLMITDVNKEYTLDIDYFGDFYFYSDSNSYTTTIDDIPLITKIRATYPISNNTIQVYSIDAIQDVYKVDIYANNVLIHSEVSSSFALENITNNALTGINLSSSDSYVELLFKFYSRVNTTNNFPTNPIAVKAISVPIKTKSIYCVKKDSKGEYSTRSTKYKSCSELGNGWSSDIDIKSVSMYSVSSTVYAKANSATGSCSGWVNNLTHVFNSAGVIASLTFSLTESSLYPCKGIGFFERKVDGNNFPNLLVNRRAKDFTWSVINPRSVMAVSYDIQLDNNGGIVSYRITGLTGNFNRLNSALDYSSFASTVIPISYADTDSHLDGDTVMVTVYDSNLEVSDTYSIVYAGGQWLNNIRMHINGNAIIEGSLTVDKLTVTGSMADATAIKDKASDIINSDESSAANTLPEETKDILLQGLDDTPLSGSSEKSIGIFTMGANIGALGLALGDETNNDDSYGLYGIGKTGVGGFGEEYGGYFTGNRTGIYAEGVLNKFVGEHFYVHTYADLASQTLANSGIEISNGSFIAFADNSSRIRVGSSLVTLNPNGTTTYSNKITMNYSSIAHYVESPYIHFQANDGGYHKDLRFTYADGLTLDTERVLVESDKTELLRYVAKNKISFKFHNLGVTWDHPDDFFNRQSFNFTDGTLVATGDFPNTLSIDTSANYVYFSDFNDLSTVDDEDGYRYYTTDEFMNDVVNGNYKLLRNDGTLEYGYGTLPVWHNYNYIYKLSGPIGRLNLYFFSFDVLIAYLKKTGDEGYTHKILAEIDGFTVLQKDVVNTNRNFNHPLQLRADGGAVKYLHTPDFHNDHGLPPIDLRELRKADGATWLNGRKFYINHLYLDLFATNLHPYKDTMIGFYDEYKTNYRYNITYASVGNLTHDNTKRYEVTITIKLNASFVTILDDEYLYFGFSFIPVDENNHIVGEKQSVYAKTFNMQIRDAKTMKIITSGNTKKLQVLYFLKNGSLSGNARLDRIRASASLDVEVTEI